MHDSTEQILCCCFARRFSFSLVCELKLQARKSYYRSHIIRIGWRLFGCARCVSLFSWNIVCARSVRLTAHNNKVGVMVKIRESSAELWTLWIHKHRHVCACDHTYERTEDQKLTMKLLKREKKINSNSNSNANTEWKLQLQVTRRKRESKYHEEKSLIVFSSWSSSSSTSYGEHYRRVSSQMYLQNEPNDLHSLIHMHLFSRSLAHPNQCTTHSLGTFIECLLWSSKRENGNDRIYK